MLQEEGSVSAGDGIQISKTSLVTIIICTGLSVLFRNIPPLSMIYLSPLGYALIATGSFWLTFCAAAAVNIILYIVSFISSPNAGSEILLLVAFFIILDLCYLWIMGGKNLRTLYRFIFASAAGAIALLFFVFRKDTTFYTMFYSVAENLSSALTGSLEGEVVEGSIQLSPERLIESTQNMLLRGGALVSMLLIFFISRQIALAVIMLIKRQKFETGFITFCAPANTAWVILGSFVTILLTKALSADIIEIIAWNAFVVSAIIFLTQGAGVLMYWFSRKSNTFRIISIVVLTIVIFISPLNILAIAALLILGIADNWRQFRIPSNRE
ncbi:MAG: hypothetical protein LBI28_01865 [Treponema sp.]|jgi:hypothetical protein|nr:hypothetical protein [Treponema sp.]